jgi:hypothetical protein
MVRLEELGTLKIEDHVKKILENHNIRKQDQEYEGKINSPQQDRRLPDIEKNTDLQKEKCQGLNENVATTVS